MGSALPRPEGLLKMEYVPRKQFVPFHKRKQRHSVLVTHRRCGKTVASICDLIIRCGKTVASICDLIIKAIKHPIPSRPGEEGGRFAYIATTYAAGKDIAWEMLKAYSRPFIAELLPSWLCRVWRTAMWANSFFWPRLLLSAHPVLYFVAYGKTFQRNPKNGAAGAPDGNACQARG